MPGFWTLNWLSHSDWSSNRHRRRWSQMAEALSSLPREVLQLGSWNGGPRRFWSLEGTAASTCSLNHVESLTGDDLCVLGCWTCLATQGNKFGSTWPGRQGCHVLFNHTVLLWFATKEMVAKLGLVLQAPAFCRCCLVVRLLFQATYITSLFHQAMCMTEAKGMFPSSLFRYMDEFRVKHDLTDLDGPTSWLS